METYWRESHWQYNTFASKQLITFSISLALTIIILSLPIKFKPTSVTQNTFISLELIKAVSVTNKTQSTINDEIYLIETETVKHKIINQVVPAQSKHKEGNTLKNAISLKKRNKSKLLPSAGHILNSLKTRVTLQKLGIDFHAKNNMFINKNEIKNPVPLLTAKKYLLKEMVEIGNSKGFLGFFAPINVKEKTQDSLPYCSLLGRRSVFCPSNSPFN